MLLIVIFAISVRIIFGGQVNSDAEVERLAMSPDLPSKKRYMPRVVTPEPRTFKRQKFESRSMTPEPVIKNKYIVTMTGGGTNLGDSVYVDQNVLDAYHGIG